MITSIEVKRRGHVRRAKLYYLRQLRGKSARISPHKDARESWISAESILPSVLIGPGSAFGKMVTALKQLQNLKGAAEGSKVRDAVTRLLQDIPLKPVAGVGRDDVFELALSLGEHLCPLMFSYDPEVADNARVGLTRLGDLISKPDPKKSTDALASFLRYLTVEVVIQLSIKHHDRSADVDLVAKDLLFAATEKAGFADHGPILMQLLLEDMDSPAIRTLAETKLGARGSETIRERVIGGEKELRQKFITLLADGREVFRFSLARDAERLFVL